MIDGPHITGFSPVARAIMSISTRASALTRTCSRAVRGEFREQGGLSSLGRLLRTCVRAQLTLPIAACNLAKLPRLLSA